MLYGWPVPNLNEQFYFVLLKRQFDPGYIVNDWFLSTVPPSHYFFNIMFGLFSQFMNIVVLGYIGRAVTTIIIIIGLTKIGRKFELTTWQITLSIGLWLIYGQSIVGGGFLIGSFEAKVISYICLIYSLDCFLEKKNVSASILLGTTFLMHPAIGLFAIPAVILSIIVIRRGFKDVIRIIAITSLCASPLVLMLLPTVFGEGAISSEGGKFLAQTMFPHHLDPVSWPKRNLFWLYAIFSFNVMHYFSNTKNITIRFLVSFQFFLALTFSIGMIFSFLGNYGFAKYYPFRLFPIFSLLLFFYHLMNAFNEHTNKHIKNKFLIGFAFLSILCFDNPAGRLIDKIRLNMNYWKTELYDDDLRKTFKWISANTKKNSIIIIPPWRKDGWFYTQRQILVSMEPSPHDSKYVEWLERLNLTVGEITRSTTRKQMENYYNGLSEKKVLGLQEKFKADYLVSKNDYSHKVVHLTDSYKVYDLRN
jgi:hypothetical protein